MSIIKSSFHPCISKLIYTGIVLLQTVNPILSFLVLQHFIDAAGFEQTLLRLVVT